MDFLKSAVASAISKGPLAAYSIGERVTLEDSVWTLNHGTKREDASRCSVFTFDINAQRRQLPVARNAFRKSRTLRHPGVVKVLETVETDTHLYLVTERLTPLSWYTRRNTLTEETIKWGLWSVAKTVKFINEDAASVHACLRLSSIFASESGEWKLGGFELLSAVQEDDAVVFSHAGLVPGSSRCQPPEVTRSGWGTYRTNAWSAADAWGYAILISDVFDGYGSGPSQPNELKDFPKSMQQTYKRLLNQNPKARPSVSTFLEQGEKSGGFFQTPLIHVAQSLENLGLKSDEEREDFVTELHKTVNDFPDEFLRHKVLPELLQSVEFGGGGPKVLSVVFQIGVKLSEEEYSAQLTPVIIRLFSSPDRALRVCLLDSLPQMINHLSQKTVNDKIFPNIVTGFSDLVPVVREQTVKAVLVLITKLSDRVINGELLKHLAKTANDAEPGIRTNTTICLGKIARNLGPNTRSKVLVAAFTRALRDPFVHARNAGIMALVATADLFSEDDCANKILPSLCPSLVDKEKLVRDQANKAIDQYLTRVRKHALSLPDTALPAAGPAANSTSNPRMPTPSQQPGAASSSDTSWAGWAISSFTNKLTSADGEIQPNARMTVLNGANSSANPGAHAPSTGRPLRGSSLNAPTTIPRQTRDTAAGISQQTTETSKLAQSFEEPDVAVEDDFWGDMDEGANDDGFGDAAWGADTADDDDHNGGADDFFDAQSSNRSSVVRGGGGGAKTAAVFDDKGEPDFAGWLKAQQASKAKKGPLPKGLGPGAAKASTSARPAAAAGAKKSVVPAAKPAAAAAAASKPTPPEENPEEDDWGDAWT